jgi:hypothetical protein
MKEFLICDMCTATISTDLPFCDFCDNDFQHSGSSAEILRFKDEIEKKIFNSDLSELLNLIGKSKFKDHPIILFRKAKALLIEYMTNDGVLEAEEFCEVLRIINTISKISEDYWTEFVLYITVLIPTAHTKLFIKDCKAICSFLLSINRDEDKIIENKMIQQIIVSEAGETFLNEYNYYIDSSNHIDNIDFLKKKEFLNKKYEVLLNTIKKNLYNT